MNINTFGIGNWNWNPWGEPEAVGSDNNAPTLLPPPPPAPETEPFDTINIGGGSNPPPIGYQPPLSTGTGVSASPEISALTDELFIQLLPWLEVFPQGRVPMQDVQLNESMSFNEQQFAWEAPQRQWYLDNDRAAYEVSLAKDFGMSWDDYHSRVTQVRRELNIASNEEARGQGGYFDYMDTTYDPLASPPPFANKDGGIAFAALIAKNGGAAALARQADRLQYGGGHWQKSTVVVNDPQDGTTRTSEPQYTWVPAPQRGPNNASGSAGQNGSGFQPIGRPGSNSGQPSGKVESGSILPPGVYDSLDKLLATSETMAKRLAEVYGKDGYKSNKEFGAAVFEKDNKIVVHWMTTGTLDEVPISLFADGLMKQDPSLNLIWVIHNHPSGGTFSDPDVTNGIINATSSNPQKRLFQGLMLGQPTGHVEIYTALRLRQIR